MSVLGLAVSQADYGTPSSRDAVITNEFRSFPRKAMYTYEYGSGDYEALCEW